MSDHNHGGHMVCLLDDAYRQSIARDNADVEKCKQRERRFNTDYNRMARNKLWADTESELSDYDVSPEEYKQNLEIWPRGRHLDTISLYSQLYDFFLFMWRHTRPYKILAIILLLAIERPFETTALSFVLQYIEENPATAPLWVYFFRLYLYLVERFLFWHYQLWVPLNSQRVQLRTVLLKQMSKLPHDHPLAYKWPSGRFTSLLNDVDIVVNGVWQSMLELIDRSVRIIYLIVLCCLNLAMSVGENSGPNAYGIYLGLFFGLAILTMAAPFAWFYLFDNKMQECERMTREGHALYMSTSQQTYTVQRALSLLRGGEDHDLAMERGRKEIANAVQSYWLYGRTTFRAHFHRLAWETNYGLITNSWSPLVAYFLMTRGSFGGSMGSANILIVLLSLRDLVGSSAEILQYLVKMSRGCNVLRDIAEILNADVESYDQIDLEKGTVHHEA